jgi:heme-binding NEAT domain protein
MDANVPMGGASTPTPQTPPTPPTPPTPSEPTPPTSESSSYADGGETSSSDKIQWVAIGIFALTMISLAYKSIYYNRAIKNIGKTNNDSSAKLAELEKNVRAIRGDKYESSN